jgi:hypothetical protein
MWPCSLIAVKKNPAHLVGGGVEAVLVGIARDKALARKEFPAGTEGIVLISPHIVNDQY